MSKSRPVTITPRLPEVAPPALHDVADLLALGFIRYRRRQLAAAATTAEAPTIRSNPLDDVVPRAPLATGDRRTSQTGVPT